MTHPPRVIGLDLSLTAAGVAAPHGLFTVGEKAKAGATLAQRRRRITAQVARVLDHVIGDDLGAHDFALGVAPHTVVAIEAPAQHATAAGHAHDRSGLWWAVVMQLAAWPGVDVVDVGIAGVKRYATGRGNAGKDEVLAAVVRRFPDEPVADNNQADALVLRAMALDHYGAPLVPMPVAHRSALAAVAWPVLEAEVAAR